jgi:hypothetical protein
VSKRSRRQKGILAFVAQDAEQRVFCYANGQIRKRDQNDEIFRFVEFWKEKTGHRPQELIFDSRLTSYANLSRLNQQGICAAGRASSCSRSTPPRPRPGGALSCRAWGGSTRPLGSWIAGSTYRATRVWCAS